jgi:hypothetical protein
MVSNSLDMQSDELLVILQRLVGSSTSDPEYQELRSALPADWPL